MGISARRPAQVRSSSGTIESDQNGLGPISDSGSAEFRVIFGTLRSVPFKAGVMGVSGALVESHPINAGTTLAACVPDALHKTFNEILLQVKTKRWDH